jgi:hypothetical protein
MKHIKQATNECFPTTLAMLTDRDVNEILAASQAISPIQHSWSSFTSTDNPEDITMTYRALARKYAPYLIDYCEPVSAFKIAEQKKYIGYQAFINMTATGKGAVLSVSRYIDKPLAHICAYEKGVVYDGCLDKELLSHDYYVNLAKKTVLCPYAIVSEY